jgi:hypothetical protein
MQEKDRQRAACLLEQCSLGNFHRLAKKIKNGSQSKANQKKGAKRLTQESLGSH